MTKFCAGAIIVKGDKFLFGKRAEGKSMYGGLWDVIGGHNEPGETPEETLTRELMEELGIIPTEYRFFYDVRVDDEKDELPYQFYIFLVTAWKGEINNCCDEHSELKWFTRDELDTLQLSSANYKMLLDEWKTNATPNSPFY